MQTSPLVQHLIDLNSDSEAQQSAGVLAPFGATHSPRRIAAADAAGFERGRRSSETEVVEKLAEIEARYAREQQEARRHWTETEASRLTTQLASSVAELRTEMSTAMARALVPFVEGRLRGHALDDLVAATVALVADAMPLTIEVSGSDDLAAILSRNLEPYGTVVRSVSSSTGELRVRADTQVLETRIKDWLATIEASLA